MPRWLPVPPTNTESIPNPQQTMPLCNPSGHWCQPCPLSGPVDRGVHTALQGALRTKFQGFSNAAIDVTGRAIAAFRRLIGDLDMGLGHQRLEVCPELTAGPEITTDVENVPLRQVGSAHRQTKRLGHIVNIRPRVLFVASWNGDVPSNSSLFDPPLHKLRRTA